MHSSTWKCKKLFQVYLKNRSWGNREQRNVCGWSLDGGQRGAEEKVTLPDASLGADSQVGVSSQQSVGSLCEGPLPPVLSCYCFILINLLLSEHFLVLKLDT